LYADAVDRNAAVEMQSLFNGRDLMIVAMMTIYYHNYIVHADSGPTQCVQKEKWLYFVCNYAVVFFV
jgi:hypothetical protein